MDIDMSSAFWNHLVAYLSFDASLLKEPAILARLFLQGGLLFGSAFFSGSETALFSLSDVDLEQLRKKRHPYADLLHELLSKPRQLIISILCGNELINIAAATNLAVFTFSCNKRQNYGEENDKRRAPEAY